MARSSTRWRCGCRSSRRTTPLAVVMGDLNVGHREFDIRNWKGNVKSAGFLPRERAYFDRFLGEAGADVAGVDGSTGLGLGWVDVGRRFHGEVDGPYTWWSSRGKAFDNDTGWRIDYHLATPALAERVTDYRVDARGVVGHALERPRPRRRRLHARRLSASGDEGRGIRRL